MTNEPSAPEFNGPSPTTPAVGEGAPAMVSPVVAAKPADSPAKWFRPRLEALIAKDDQLGICKLLEEVQGYRLTRMLSFEEIMPVTVDQTRKEMQLQLKMCEVTVNVAAKAQKELDMELIDGGTEQSASKIGDEFDRTVHALTPAEYDKGLTLSSMISELGGIRKVRRH